MIYVFVKSSTHIFMTRYLLLQTASKAAFTLIYMLMVYILIYILIYTLIYKQLRLYINLYIKKQNVFLLRNDGLYSINTFQIKLSLI